MNNYQLDVEEQEILNDFEAGEFKSVLTPQRKTILAKVAEETLKQDKYINIRISVQDLDVLEQQARQKGVSYQTLATTILRQYLSDSLHDLTVNNAISAQTSHSSRVAAHA